LIHLVSLPTPWARHLRRRGPDANNMCELCTTNRKHSPQSKSSLFPIPHPCDYKESKLAWPFKSDGLRHASRADAARTRSKLMNRSKGMMCASEVQLTSCMPHLLLQLENAIHQCLTRRWTPRHVDIHRHDAITAPRHTVTVMVIPAPIGAAPHADHPPRIRHLVVDLSESGSHLVGECAGYDHDVGLARAGAEDYAQAVLVVARGGEVHHLDGAAGEAEGHGPEGALAGPVGDLVEGCSGGGC